MIRKFPALLIGWMVTVCICTAQNTSNFQQPVSINNDGSDPDASAILDVQSTSGGMLVPRMNSNEREGISSPENGLIVYDTDFNSFWYFNGTFWKDLQENSSTNSLPATPSSCAPYPCPTMLSTTKTGGTVSWGECSRYCYDLVEATFDDWRMPTQDELVYLYPSTTSEAVSIWTSSSGNDSSSEWLVISLVNGFLEGRNANVFSSCKCVR